MKKKNLISTSIFLGSLMIISLFFVYKVFAVDDEISTQTINGDKSNIDADQAGLGGFIYSVRAMEDSQSFKTLANVGTLYKEPNQAVYLLDDPGYKYHVPNPTTFDNFGFSWSRVNVLSETLNKPYGGPLNNLIKGSGSEIYALDQGVKRHIESMASFRAWDFKWETISFLSDRLVNSIPSSSFISQLAKSPGDPKIYLIENGKRRWITSMNVFIRNGYRWEFIGIVSDALLLSKPEGAPVR